MAAQRILVSPFLPRTRLLLSPEVLEAQLVLGLKFLAWGRGALPAPLL